MRGLPVLVMFLIVVGCINVGLSVHAETWQPWWTGLLAGCALAEAAMVSLIAALVGRHWLRGYTWGLVVSWCWVLAAAAGNVPYRELLDLEFNHWCSGIVSLIRPSFFVPAALAVAIIPLAVLRFWRGWRLVDIARAEAGSLATPWAVAMIACGMVLVCNLVWIVCGLGIPGEPSFIREDLAYALWFGVASALMNVAVVPWNVRWVLARDQERANWRRVGVYLAGVIPCAILALTVLDAEDDVARSEAWRVVASAAASSIPLFFAFLWLLRRSGFRLARGPTTAAETSADEAAQRWLRGPMIALAALTLVPLLAWADEARRRQNWVREFQTYEPAIRALGGWAEMVDAWYGAHTIVRLDKVPITDDDLLKISAFRNITFLNLRGAEVSGIGLASLECSETLNGLNLVDTNVDDAACETIARFHRLTSLHLDRTRVTSHGLEVVARLGRLEYLTLSGCDISEAGIIHLARLQRLDKLDLRGAPISENSAETIASFKLQMLSLAGADLSDGALARLGQNRLIYLNLAGTPIQGTGFGSWPPDSRLVTLILDDTRVDDEGIRNLPALSHLRNLRLVRTAVTDDCVTHLITIGRELEDGPCNLLVAEGALSSDRIKMLEGAGFFVSQVSADYKSESQWNDLLEIAR